MTRSILEDDHSSAEGLAEVLSDDAQTRGIELAFFERLVEHAAHVSAIQLGAARGETKLEHRVIRELDGVRNQVWKRLALEMEKTHPAQADFGEFGRYRAPDR